MDLKITMDLLKKSSFFHGLSEEHLKAFANTCTVTQIPKKRILFLEGTVASKMYLIFNGVVRLYRTAPDGREVVVKVVKPHDVFAEVVVFEGSDYPVSAEAIADSSFLEMPRKAIEVLLNDAKFRNGFIATLVERQRFLVERIQHLITFDVEERFFIFLRSHYGDKDTVNINISKQDMASVIGTTPETLSRLIRRLEIEKRILWEGPLCHILDKTVFDKTDPIENERLSGQDF